MPQPAAPPVATPAPAPAPAPAPQPEPMPTYSTPPAPPPQATTPDMGGVSPDPVPAEAAPEAAAPPPAGVSGYVESAYHLNLSKPQANTPVPLRSYDGQSGNTFLLHNAHLAVNHSFNEDVSAVVEIDAGSDAAVDAAGSNGTTGALYGFDVQEAYAKYAHHGFSLYAGKFVTYEGIEVVEGPSNPTLTRGFLYNFAEPVTHIGTKMHYAVNDTVDLGIGVVNGWDQWIDNNDWKTIIFRIGLTPSPDFFAALSGSVGSEQVDDKHPRVSIDLTGAYIMDSFTLNFQGNFGLEKFEGAMGAASVSGSWFGFGVQPVYKSGAFSFGSRLEYFNDHNGARVPLAPKGQYLNITLDPGVTLAEHFLLRFEYRADIVLSGNPGAGGKDLLNGKSTQHTIGLGASYVF
jgi:Putative beta-barrel porin-2, OmpL-like. bbp2